MSASTTPTPLRAAFEARDHEALVEAFAPDVVLRSPIFEVLGRLAHFFRHGQSPPPELNDKAPISRD